MNFAGKEILGMAEDWVRKDSTGKYSTGREEVRIVEEGMGMGMDSVGKEEVRIDEDSTGTHSVGKESGNMDSVGRSC